MSSFTRFGQIFWGLLLVILDFRFDGLDVLPDCMGYVLVAIGCGGLASVSKGFATARTLSWILAVLSLADFVVPIELALMFGLLDFAMACAMMWFLLGGVMEFASARQRPDLSARASNRRVAYVVLMGIATFAGIVANGAQSIAGVLAFASAVCVLPVLVLILHLIHRVKHELAVAQTFSLPPAAEPSLGGPADN